jgi:hypothetical protein
MPLSTFDELKQSISDHLDRDDLPVADFISLSEASNKQEIHLPDGTIIPPVLIREMVVRAQAAFTTRFLALPDDFMQMQTVKILGDPVKIVDEVSQHELNRLRKNTAGTPEYFTIHEEIEFNRVPDQELTAELIYWAELTPLSAANPSNALLSRAPNVYLYGALAASAPFLMNDERVATWGTLYVTARRGLSGADRRSRRAGPLIARVHGATP